MIFDSRPLVSKDMALWVEDMFEWYTRSFFTPDAPILPTRDFFSAGRGDQLEMAQAVLQDVKALLKVDVEIKIAPMPIIPEDLDQGYGMLSEVAGTYQQDEDGRLIRYNPKTLKRPVEFINTMAHEVMHARLTGLEDETPGGRDAHELATDMSCIIAGFGVFQLQAADDVGWTGYLSQNTRAHALAYFLKQKGLELDAITTHLAPRPLKLVKRAFRNLSKK